MGYTNWLEEGTAGIGCVYMDSLLRWVSTTCDRNMRFLCKGPAGNGLADCQN